MNFIQTYIEAFNSCYPHVHVRVKPKRVREELRYIVFINEEGGDITLSESDIRSATRMFMAGKGRS